MVNVHHLFLPLLGSIILQSFYTLNPYMVWNFCETYIYLYSADIFFQILNLPLSNYILKFDTPPNTSFYTTKGYHFWVGIWGILDFPTLGGSHLHAGAFSY
jgi:hypothetical protein